MTRSRRAANRLPGAAVAALLLAMTVRLPEAPATIAEQRARLPPAAECESDVAGKWKGVVFTLDDSSWYDTVLEVRHVEGSSTALTGMIYVDTWRGGPDDSEPGPCRGRRFKGKMVGSGTFSGGQVDFGGGAFELTEFVCGEPIPITYNPDRFTGRIDKERQEFQSVNNDGGSAVNEPYVFRRIGCVEDEQQRKPADVVPPPFFPARRESGC